MRSALVVLHMEVKSEPTQVDGIWCFKAITRFKETGSNEDLMTH